PSSVLSAPPAPPDLHSFPTRRSSDLQRLEHLTAGLRDGRAQQRRIDRAEGLPQVGTHVRAVPWRAPPHDPAQRSAERVQPGQGQDRKSTRLNSSHVKISYAVFCLKKK